ncbi:serine protease do-like HtrA [Coprobacillus sp. CAG:605]|nr:serine protease do-like HtrA [Coprobacillus sp. CAG:605]
MKNEKEVINATIVKPRKERSSNNVWIKLLVMFCLIAIGAAGMYGVIKLMPGTTIVNKLEKEVTVNEQGIADAVEKVYDSVVVVENLKAGELQATGTGFIFKKSDNKYYVMTNYHVINGASSVKIQLTNNKELNVEVLGGDNYSDIAILAFESKDDYSIAEIGSSTDARVGDTTFAVGAPVDSTTYSWSVTRGIVSGKDRMVKVSTSSQTSSSDYIMKVLQTDAAINSGNSGGPLCNSNGQVIGITNMKLVSNSTSNIEGMGFAIPIEDAIDFANKIINGEDITRPTLGVSMLDISSTGLAYYNISVPDNVTNGVVIMSVSKNSAAEEGGLKKGDVILEIDNVKVTSSALLKYELYRHNIGDEITLKINRNGFEKALKIKLTK